MEIKRTAPTTQIDTSSISERQPSQSKQNSNDSDQIVPYSADLFSSANLLSLDNISITSAKIQETQAFLEDVSRTALKAITDPDLRSKLQEFIGTAKDTLQSPIVPQKAYTIIGQKAKEMMEHAEQNATMPKVLSVVAAAVMAVVAIVIAVFTFGAADDSLFIQIVVEELRKIGVNVDPEALNQITGALSKGGQEASSVIDFLAALRNAAQLKVK